MTSLKPFLKALLISSAIFLLVVFLGIKYHWVKVLQHKNDKQISLQLPDNQTEIASPPPELLQEDEFQPEIINQQLIQSKLSNMTKEQITIGCQRLFKTALNEGQKELLIGNCVVSNYQESIQAISNIGSTVNRQKLTQKQNAQKNCQNQITRQQKNLKPLENELLLGICVSNQMNR